MAIRCSHRLLLGGIAHTPTLQADPRMRLCRLHKELKRHWLRFFRLGPLFRMATQYTVPGLKGTWDEIGRWPFEKVMLSDHDSCGSWLTHVAGTGLKTWTWHWILWRTVAGYESRHKVAVSTPGMQNWVSGSLARDCYHRCNRVAVSPMSVPLKHWQLRRVAWCQTVRRCTFVHRSSKIPSLWRLATTSWWQAWCYSVICHMSHVTSVMQRLCLADFWWLCEVDVLKLHVQATLLSLPLLWIPTPATKWSWRTTLSCLGMSGMRLLRLWSCRNVMW